MLVGDVNTGNKYLNIYVGFYLHQRLVRLIKIVF